MKKHITLIVATSIVLIIAFCFLIKANNNPTISYYFYSTVAQTLAGAFGFLGAFVLFRLQSIDRACEKAFDFWLENFQMRDYSAGFILSVQKELSDDWDAVADGIRAEAERYHKKQRPDSCKTLEKEFNGNFPEYLRLKNYAHKQYEVKTNFYRALIFTVITISISLVLLALVPQLIKNNLINKVCLAVTLLFSLMCICLYAQTIHITFGKTSPKHR